MSYYTGKFNNNNLTHDERKLAYSEIKDKNVFITPYTNNITSIFITIQDKVENAKINTIEISINAARAF